MENTNTGNRPEKKFSAGAISATVWKNQAQNQQGQPVEFRTIQIDRRYKDRSGNWKSTTSMRVNDLPKVALVSNEAYRYIVLKGEGEPLQNSGGYTQTANGENVQVEDIVM